MLYYILYHMSYVILLIILYIILCVTLCAILYDMLHIIPHYMLYHMCIVNTIKTKKRERERKSLSLSLSLSLVQWFEFETSSSGPARFKRTVIFWRRYTRVIKEDCGATGNRNRCSNRRDFRVLPPPLVDVTGVPRVKSVHARTRSLFPVVCIHLRGWEETYCSSGGCSRRRQQEREREREERDRRIFSWLVSNELRRREKFLAIPPPPG